MTSTITIKINGKSFDTAAQATIIQVADQAGIYIPRFCYHKKLSVAANCRMCLVEVEGANKPLPACATPVMPEMEVWTRSPKAKAAQRSVMEFLLINHPLDCPICDQGGQCELQDLAMRYGRDDAEFLEAKRAVPDDDLGPLVSTAMTRCIHCTRCVRFGEEIAGQQELGATGRGETMQITTYVKHSLRSPLSGNIIDLCPVGALVSKPFKFKARAWELKRAPSIAPHDCVGSHLYLHIYDEKVVRVVPRENDKINETWLSDRDRYSYLGLESNERVTKPMIKIGNGWQETDWPTALGQTARLVQAILRQHGAEQLGGLISPSATLEELFLFQTLCRCLGSSHIDHRLRQVDTRDQQNLPDIPKSDLSIAELDECDLIVLIGSNLPREQPILTTRLRKLVSKGGAIVSLNCVDYDFSLEIAQKIIVSPDQLVTQVATLARHCGAPLSNAGILVDPDPRLAAIAQRLQAAKKAAILIGAVTEHHPQSANLRYWITQLALVSKAASVYLTEGANSCGAWLAGAIPHRDVGGQALPESKIGLAAHEMFSKKLKAYFLFNVEPALDCAMPADAQAAMKAAECVVAFTAFKSSSLLASAHILLPIAPFAENEGTLINLEGNWQSFNKIVPHLGEARLGWQVLQALSKILQINTINYSTTEEIRNNIRSIMTSVAQQKKENAYQPLPKEPEFVPMRVPGEEGTQSLMRITEWPLYSVDPLVRQSTALQEAGSCEKTGAYIHPKLAKRLALSPGEYVRLAQGEAVSQLIPIMIDSAIPDNCVWTPAARSETATLGASFGEIAIIKEDAR